MLDTDDISFMYNKNNNGPNIDPCYKLNTSSCNTELWCIVEWDMFVVPNEYVCVVLQFFDASDNYTIKHK